MKGHYDNITVGDRSSVSYNYSIFESLKYPVCIIDNHGSISYGNEAFQQFSESGENEIRLDWKDPLFQEYRKNIAQAYLDARNGTEKQCFAVINSPDGSLMTLEIYLFPMFEKRSVSSILVLLKAVDNKFPSQNMPIPPESEKSLYYQFSPMPILRINEESEIIKFSHSFEGFLGYSAEEILEKKSATFKSIFTNDSERVLRAISDLITGDLPFKRIGEVKIQTNESETKIVNLVLYPIVQNNVISAIEIIMEDIIFKTGP